MFFDMVAKAVWHEEPNDTNHSTSLKNGANSFLPSDGNTKTNGKTKS